QELGACRWHGRKYWAVKPDLSSLECGSTSAQDRLPLICGCGSLLSPMKLTCRVGSATSREYPGRRIQSDLFCCRAFKKASVSYFSRPWLLESRLLLRAQRLCLK